MSENTRNDEVLILSIPNNERINKLGERFSLEFQCKPSFFARVPGRVNIIGEHIDYCGYPVLPMAIEQDILVAVGVITEHKLYLRNANSKYDKVDIDIKSFETIDIKADSNGKPFWYNYVLCGIKGALEHLNKQQYNGIRLYVDGNIPPASGLSSSSALVSAACLAFLHAQDAKLNKTEIASLCARSERYIGTQGGGMDQAIAFLAEKYSAQYITWQPLNATPVALPEDASFVVAHSLAEANKAATNDYNRRVMECRLAAKILAISIGITTEETIITLSQVQKLGNKSLEEMVTLVNKYLPKDLYTKDEVCKILMITGEELNDRYSTPNTKYLTEFKLKQRGLHVYEEALRVENFRKICLQLNTNLSVSNGTNGHTEVKEGNDNTLEILGSLMSASHESLKNLFECSHKNLDILVDMSRELNVHSRLTGAGWGGCIVALCPKDKLTDYIEKLRAEYYVKHCNIDKNEANYYVFATSPNYGARIYQ
ncbi:N-acetylgalactosamine kinase [Epargyreus clarus]|uniref:N-acetylgalactosamine kinase n=1 Tax=Epargyreus clarus TaxID=520877 RepID=UPI003C307DBD